MFERYTENARRAIFLARYEASIADSRLIHVHHLLLGTLRSDEALRRRILGDQSIDEFRREFGEPPAESHVSTTADLPFSSACKRAIAFGAEEANLARSRHIDILHLIGGLLQDDTPARTALLQRGIDLQRWRSEELGAPRTDLRIEGEQMLSKMREDRLAASIRVLQALQRPAVSIQVRTDEEEFTLEL